MTPLALAVHYLTGAGDTVDFVLAALALVPLAWLVGEATEHASEHTGPGVGGFLNASFGNAPELIIAVFAIRDGLPDIVRGSITGSIVSNLLLVLGLTMVAGQGRLDRRSLLVQLGLVLGAVVAFLGPSIAGSHGDPDRHSLFLVSVPIALVLLVLYAGVSVHNLRVHRNSHASPAGDGAWSLRRALVALGAATAATALVSEVLVGSLTSFGDALGLSDFFVAVVIVAIVGNAAEHGGAVVVARRGKTKLASEIATASAAQVAVCVAPAVVLLSGLAGRGLPFSFRPVELGAIAFASLLVFGAVLDGFSTRRQGALLLAGYALAVVAFALVGDR